MSEHLDHRPVKVIIPHADDLHTPKAGGGKGKDFAYHAGSVWFPVCVQRTGRRRCWFSIVARD